MPKKKAKKDEIIIYKSSTGPQLEVNFQQGNIWLSQAQIAKLFGTERSVITKHLRNIFNTGELKEKSNVQKMHIAGSDKPVNYYSLDAVISIGYRVNSKRATHFRIWASKVVKDYLTKGYAINRPRLKARSDSLKELQKAISFLQKKAGHRLLRGQSVELLALLGSYTRSLSLLEKYDKGELDLKRSQKARFKLRYDDCLAVISAVKNDLMAKRQASELFGRENDRKLEAIVKNLYQTYAGKELYKSLEEKGAHLLYLIIKDHPFVDGNKRIASFLFVYFLDMNSYLYRTNKELKINDNALASLALLIALSDPKEKDTMIRIITNLLQ